MAATGGSIRRCLVAGCNAKHYASGYCQLHYQRSRPRPDGTVPSLAEIAGLAPRRPARTYAFSGRVTAEAGERLEKHVRAKKATSVHALVSAIVEAWRPAEG